MGLWKEEFIGKIQSGSLIFMWGGVAQMSDACGPLLEYNDAQKTPTTLLHLFEELHIVHCARDRKLMAPEWTRLYCSQSSWPPIHNRRLKFK